MYIHVARGKIKMDVIISNLSDHYGTLTTYLDKKRDKLKFKVTKRWLKREHYEEIREKLATTNWRHMTDMNVDEATEYLNNQIITIMDEVCPISTKTLGNKPCLLYTSPSPRDRQKSRMPSSA